MTVPAVAGDVVLNSRQCWGRAKRVEFLTKDQHRSGHPDDCHVKPDDDADPEMNLENRPPEEQRARPAKIALNRSSAPPIGFRHGLRHASHRAIDERRSRAQHVKPPSHPDHHLINRARRSASNGSSGLTVVASDSLMSVLPSAETVSFPWLSGLFGSLHDQLYWPAPPRVI